MRAKTSTAFASVLIGAIAALSAPADAACKKFGFTVNDYGKDGPTNDAKNLLDKHIAEWAAQNNVGEYSTGKKNVSCELFLDVILFDEHTCTASATVCWGPDAKKLGNQSQSAAAPADESGAGAPPAPVRKAHALGQATTQAAAAAPAAAAPATEAAAADTAQVDAAPTQPVEQIAAPEETMPVAPAVHATTTPAAAPSAPSNAAANTGAVVETGALQAGQALTQATQKPAASEKDRAAAAAAAASAAAAAERAAMAAETAANAAKEAAAAAVAASAASKGTTVPPLDHASGAKPAHTE